LDGGSEGLFPGENSEVVYSRYRRLSFAEFKLIAQEHGFQWRPHPEIRGVYGSRFQALSAGRMPHFEMTNYTKYFSAA